MTFTCPRCRATSHHPKDEEHGYCGQCHDFTGNPTLHQELTALFQLRLAADQRATTLWKEAHPGSDLVWPDHTDLVFWLLDQLAIAQRMNRVHSSLAKQLSRSMMENAKLHVRNTNLEEALQRIQQWSEAYPLAVFPEPDFKKAAELLQAGGITLDAVSASSMRHVIEGVGKIASEALLTSQQGASHG